MNHFLNIGARAGTMTFWQLPLRLLVAVVVLRLAACAHTRQPVSQTPSRPTHEYLIYQIDDYRYITIRSTSRCILDQMDGEIFYYDTKQNVRTFVAYTGHALNGLYKGYYAVHSDPQYVAIPSPVFSQTRGMMLHVNYSHDGGRTFQWFLAGGSVPSLVFIQKNSLLFSDEERPTDPKSYSHEGASVLDLNQDVDLGTARYAMNGDAFRKFGKDVTREQIPLDLKSPSAQTHWSCPVVPVE